MKDRDTTGFKPPQSQKKPLPIQRGKRRFLEFLLPLHCGIEPMALETVLRRTSMIEIVLYEWSKDRGAGSLWDLLTIVSIAKARLPKICFEIGTGQGRTSLHLALNTLPGTEIYTLDIHTDPSTGSILSAHPNDKVRQLIGDSRTFDYDQWLGRVDLVIVDGSHDYESVKQDTETAFALVSKEGCILWDDFAVGWPGVRRALKHSTQTKWMRRIPGTKLVYYSSDLTR